MPRSPAATRTLALAAVAALALLSHLAAVAAPAAAAAPAPSAPGAGGVRVELVIGDAHRLVPEQPADVAVVVRACAAPGAALAGPVSVALSVATKPAWLDARFEPATHAMPPLLPDECREAHGRLRLTASRAAAAFTQASLGAVAHDAASGRELARATAAVNVGYLADARVTPADSRVAVPLGAPATLRLHVENAGNAASRLDLEVYDAGGARVALPPGLELAPGARGTWDVTFLLVDGDGLAPRDVHLLVRARALDAPDGAGAEGTPQTVRVHLAPEAGRVTFQASDLLPFVGELAPFVVTGVVGVGVAWWDARRAARRSGSGTATR